MDTSESYCTIHLNSEFICEGSRRDLVRVVVYGFVVQRGGVVGPVVEAGMAGAQSRADGAELSRSRAQQTQGKKTLKLKQKIRFQHHPWLKINHRLPVQIIPAVCATVLLLFSDGSV